MVQSEFLDDSVPRSDDEASQPSPDNDASQPSPDNEGYPKSTADDPATESPAGPTPAPAAGKGGHLSEYILMKDRSFDSVNLKAGTSNSSPEKCKCALECSQNPECESFSFFKPRKVCALHRMRPCMAPGSGGTKLDIYEKKANVTVGKQNAYMLISKFRCGKYIGKKIGIPMNMTIKSADSDDILAKHANSCGQGCATRKDVKCASYLFSTMKTTLKNGTEQIQTTCSFFEDSIYTVPNSGLYKICPPDDKQLKMVGSWYGIAGQVPSIANCGKMITAV